MNIQFSGENQIKRLMLSLAKASVNGATHSYQQYKTPDLSGAQKHREQVWYNIGQAEAYAEAIALDEALPQFFDQYDDETLLIQRIKHSPVRPPESILDVFQTAEFQALPGPEKQCAVGRFYGALANILDFFKPDDVPSYNPKLKTLCDNLLTLLQLPLN
jgi:hypothetical protein